MRKTNMTGCVVLALLSLAGVSSASYAQGGVSQTDILLDYYRSHSRWPISLAEMERHYEQQERRDFVEYLATWNDCSAVLFEPNRDGSLTVKTWRNRLRLRAGAKSATRLEGVLLAFHEMESRWPHDRIELEKQLRESGQEKALRFVSRFSVLDWREVNSGFKEVRRDLLVKWDIDVSDTMKAAFDRQEFHETTYFRPR